MSRTIVEDVQAELKKVAATEQRLLRLCKRAESTPALFKVVTEQSESLLELIGNAIAYVDGISTNRHVVGFDNWKRDALALLEQREMAVASLLSPSSRRQLPSITSNTSPVDITRASELAKLMSGENYTPSPDFWKGN